MLRGAVGRTGRSLLLAVVGLACLGPVVWVVSSSFKTQAQVYGGGLVPTPFSLDGYKALFTEVDILRFLVNTALYAVGGTVGALTIALLAAYPAARMRFPFRHSLAALFSLGLAIPITGLIVPEFVIMRDIGLFNTQLGMVVFYSAMWFPLAFVILRVCLTGLPPTLETAAALDRARYFQLVRNIVMPLANVQVGLALFRGQFTTDIAAILAGTTAMMIIPMTIFVLFQRPVIAGLNAGSSR